MENFRRDLRLGLRQLSKRPGFALLTILTLAAGIGANTAVLSFVDAVLVRSLPYPEPDRLALLWEDYSHEGMPQMATSYAGFLDWRQQSSSASTLLPFPETK